MPFTQEKHRICSHKKLCIVLSALEIVKMYLLLWRISPGNHEILICFLKCYLIILAISFEIDNLSIFLMGKVDHLPN